MAQRRPDSGRAGEGLVTAEAWMLASEPDPTQPDHKLYFLPRKRSAPGAAKIVLVAVAIILGLVFFFGVLTLLTTLWSGWDARCASLLNLVVLSGLGAFTCAWLVWRLESSFNSANGGLFTRKGQRPSGYSPQASGFLYCERDQVVFEPANTHVEPAMVTETLDS